MDDKPLTIKKIMDDYRELSQKRFNKEATELLKWLEAHPEPTTPEPDGSGQPDGVGDRTWALWDTFTEEQRQAILDDIDDADLHAPSAFDVYDY